MSELVRKEPIRFSQYVIQQIKDRNFDGLISMGLCSGDSLVLMSPNYYHRKSSHLYAHNWSSVSKDNIDDTCWILDGWTTWFGTKKHISLMRGRKYLPYNKEHQNEIDQLYDAFVYGIDYLKEYVEPIRKDEISREIESRFWL